MVSPAANGRGHYRHDNVRLPPTPYAGGTRSALSPARCADAGCRVIAEGRYNSPALAAEANPLWRMGGDGGVAITVWNISVDGITTH